MLRLPAGPAHWQLWRESHADNLITVGGSIISSIGCVATQHRRSRSSGCRVWSWALKLQVETLNVELWYLTVVDSESSVRRDSSATASGTLHAFKSYSRLLGYLVRERGATGSDCDLLTFTSRSGISPWPKRSHRTIVHGRPTPVYTQLPLLLVGIFSNEVRRSIFHNVTRSSSWYPLPTINHWYRWRKHKSP